MNAVLRLFEQRVRGIRLIELVGVALALGMIFWVCLSKAREGEDIRRMNELDAQIATEEGAVQTLKIKVAQLEKPSRLEALAKQYLGMQPVSAAHEADIDSLGEISRATSRPVTSPVPVGPDMPAAPVAGAAPAEAELITTAKPTAGGH
ncbi:septum formation inhibitor MinC [Asticcacaulis sp. AC460]|uniref:cell division protein FtsL n=1 Tax=Asticcacaulis sp. AC460 TaxID=1282360 RepID=UPI0003C3B939|nr:septum site-determining protein MinC [Asticcacaulis sp. AC460]ESQ93539.1 septum formation inhibitor MinC [Asticcacaulis sp. AC460]